LYSSFHQYYTIATILVQSSQCPAGKAKTTREIIEETSERRTNLAGSQGDATPARASSRGNLPPEKKRQPLIGESPMGTRKSFPIQFEGQRDGKALQNVLILKERKQIHDE